MVCPNCSKRGVTFRMPNGGDCYTCRYCGWSIYVNGDTRLDLDGHAALRAANPHHPELTH